MTAIGFLSGAFVLKAGDTMTGPLTLPADPTQPLQAATKQYVDNSGGGGGVPSTRLINTVNGLQGGGDLSADRTFEPVYGSASNTVCEGDDPRLSDARTPLPHNTTHFANGSDPLTASDVDADAAGSAAAALAAAIAYADSVKWLHVESPLLTGGNIVVPNSGSPTQIGPDLTLPADVDHVIAASIRCLVNPAGGELYWNVATIVGGVPVTYFGNKTSSWPFPLGGISSWFCNVDDFTSPRGEAKLKLGPQDISPGNVVIVRFFAQADNNPRTVRADAGQPLELHLVNQKVQS